MYKKILFIPKTYFWKKNISNREQQADDMIARGMMSSDHKTDNFRMQ